MAGMLCCVCCGVHAVALMLCCTLWQACCAVYAVLDAVQHDMLHATFELKHTVHKASAVREALPGHMTEARSCHTMVSMARSKDNSLINLHSVQTVSYLAQLYCPDSMIQHKRLH